MAKIIKKEKLHNSEESVSIKEWQSVDPAKSKVKKTNIIKKNDELQKGIADGSAVFNERSGTRVVPIKQNDVMQGITVYCGCGEVIEVQFEYDTGPRG